MWDRRNIIILAGPCAEKNFVKPRSAAGATAAKPIISFAFRVHLHLSSERVRTVEIWLATNRTPVFGLFLSLPRDDHEVKSRISPVFVYFYRHKC